MLKQFDTEKEAMAWIEANTSENTQSRWLAELKKGGYLALLIEKRN